MNFQIPLADDPSFSTIARERHLSDAQIEQVESFGRDGYLVIDLGLPDLPEIIAGIKRDLGSIEDGRMQDAWTISAHVKQLACLQIVTDTLDVLYGRRCFPFQTLNFPVGTQQKAHSDTVHFHAIPERFMAGVWIPLEPTDANNGPVFYYPGSQKLPCYTLADVGVRGSDSEIGGKDLYQQYYEPMIARVIEKYGLERHEAHLQPGQAFIWAANLIHGGSPIHEAGRTRNSQVTHYLFDDCIYYTPLYSDPAIGKIYYRDPIDIATGRQARIRYCGTDFDVPATDDESPLAPASQTKKVGFVRRVFGR